MESRIIIVLGLIVLPIVFFIWSAIRDDKKIQKEPLREDEKNQCFIKLIIDITNELKGLEKESDVKLFLEKTKEEKETFDKSTSYSDYNEASLMATATGAIGAILGSSSINARNLLTSISTTRGSWKEYLLNKVIRDDMSEKEKERLSGEIENKINYLLNSRVLLITKQSCIKYAWENILKDKTLKIFSLDKANLMIYRILIDPNFCQQKNEA